MAAEGPSWCQWQGDDLLLRVRLQPRAANNQVVGEQGGSLKIRLTAPPVEGKANGQLIEYLAGLFKVPKSRVTLVSGETGRDKRLRIEAPQRLPDFVPSDTKPG